MESLTDILVSQILNALDSAPVSPTREDKYLAFLICKNLSDLCETGRAIINEIELKGNPIDSFPDRSNIGTCQRILKKFYSEDMFIEDPEVGNKPNWLSVKSFPPDKSDTAFRIYKAIRKNVVDKPMGKAIQEAIKTRDKIFFIKNFDTIFADIPFKDGLIKFKNFVASPYTLNDEQMYIWDFFETLLDIFINEEENLEDLCSM